MLAKFLTGTGKLFFSIFAATFIYAVGATIFIKSLTQDNKNALDLASEARATAMDVQSAQSIIGVEVVRSLTKFEVAVGKIETEVRLLKEEIRRERTR